MGNQPDSSYTVFASPLDIIRPVYTTFSRDCLFQRRDDAHEEGVWHKTFSLRDIT